MCTCIKINKYFGRNLDLDYSFNEKVIITPRNFKLNFKKEKCINNHYALIGIGTIIDGYPLYAEAINEKGLGVACLNFPNNCSYHKKKNNMNNYAPYEIILLILSSCKNIKEVKNILQKINIVNIDFSDEVKLTPLHYMISDKNNSIVIESIKDGIKIYENPFDVLTNNPPFPYHKDNISNYLNLTNEEPENKINNRIDISPYSFGQGAMGLPGDFSSSSRFIRAFFIKSHLIMNDDEKFNILQFFKCLDSVSMIKGTVKTKVDFEYTRYSCCGDLETAIYYYKTYKNPQIVSINLRDYDLNINTLKTFNLLENYEIINQSNL